MSFWQKLFSRKKKRTEQFDDREQAVYLRDDVDFQDPQQRSSYISECLEQIADASKEIHLLTEDYNRVTASLMDLDEVEAIPGEEREELNLKAQKLVTLEQERQSYQNKKNRMSDGEYQAIKDKEQEITEGIGKLRECEKYAVLVKQDMQRLTGERHAYAYRREELYGILSNLKSMAVIFVTALVLCMVMLLILQFGFEMDTYLGYFLTVTVAAIALTVLCVKYLDADQERKRVEVSINKLIQLQNKVKIRYVNNTNLLEYLCVKYHTTGANELDKQWKRYQQEKEERKQYAEAEAKIEYYRKQLMSQLTNYHISDPYRFVSRPESLLDPKEMVENRHDLIQTRQQLRKQLEYNQEVADTARKEVLTVVDSYPEYRQEIMDLVEIYDKREN